MNRGGQRSVFIRESVVQRAPRMERPPKAARTAASPPFLPAVPKTLPPPLQLPPAAPSTPPAVTASANNEAEPPPQLRSVIERYYQPYFAVGA